MSAYTHTHTHTYIYIYIYTHTHTHTHIYIREGCMDGRTQTDRQMNRPLHSFIHCLSCNFTVE